MLVGGATLICICCGFMIKMTIGERYVLDVLDFNKPAWLDQRTSSKPDPSKTDAYVRSLKLIRLVR